jgi:NitT/TauT family transport system ATP-binding protein
MSGRTQLLGDVAAQARPHADGKRQTRLEFRGVAKRFAGTGRQEPVTAIANVSLKVADGEVVSIIGPSGCGKSTLLNLSSGLDKPNEGEVLVDGSLVVGPNEHVAFMLQKDLLLPWRTIQQNVELGLEIRGLGAKERRERSTDWLGRCHLANFAHAYPRQLSGGMRQRAALARTLAMDPDVILLDEPFSALDAQTKMILQRDLAVTLVETGRTALFITHDLNEAVAMSDRVLVMSARPGTIIEEIVIDLPDRDKPFARRADPKANRYVGRMMGLLGLDRLDLLPV